MKYILVEVRNNHWKCIDTIRTFTCPSIVIVSWIPYWDTETGLLASTQWSEDACQCDRAPFIACWKIHFVCEMPTRTHEAESIPRPTADSDMYVTLHLAVRDASLEAADHAYPRGNYLHRTRCWCQPITGNSETRKQLATHNDALNQNGYLLFLKLAKYRTSVRR